MKREAANESRELTTIELNAVSGGGFGAFARLIDIATSKAGEANQQALQAADRQRELSDRQKALRKLQSAFDL